MQDARTNGITQHCNGTGQQSVFSEDKAPREHSRVTAQSGEANTGRRDDPPICTMRTDTQAAASCGNEAADIHSAHGRCEARFPKRDGGAKHPKAAAKKRAAANGRDRHTASAHADRPRNDAEMVVLRPPKRRGVHARSAVIGPPSAQAGKVLPMHPARPAGRATASPSQQHRQRYASEDTAASAQADKVRRFEAPPKPVPDARLMGRGWHERWPPPAQGSGGLNGCAAL